MNNLVFESLHFAHYFSLSYGEQQNTYQAIYQAPQQLATISQY